MIKNKNSVFFIITLAAAVILNVVIGYTNSNQQSYISYENTSISKSNLEYADNILASYDSSEYKKAINDLQNENIRLERFRDALAKLNDDRTSYRYGNIRKKEEAKAIVGESKMTDAEALERQLQIRYCLERLDYAVGYPNYLSEINNNVSGMSDVSIFGSSIYKNIVRAENEFYGLEGIRISAESDIGVNLLFSDNVTDILGIMAAALCALFFTFRCRSSSALNSSLKGRITLFSIMLALGIAALYVSNIFLTERAVGIGSLDRSIQSAEEFRSCPYVISVGAVMALRIVFKMAACVIVFFLCTAVFSSKKLRFSAGVVLAAAAIETILYLTGSRIRFITLLNSEDIIGKYNNTFVFGETVNSVLIFSAFCIILFAAAGFMAVRAVNGMILQSREESERKYYSEVNDKYTETRLIRHDIKNHLTAVAMLMDEGRIDEARKYLDDISVEMDNARMPIQTGSAVLDALLFKKQEDMRKADIDIEIEFNVSFYDTGISGYDLCSIFGNILDNAIEASEDLSGEDKKVRLSVKRQMDMICIFCENRYKSINKDLSTMKADKSVHGLGLSRVRRTAEKYSGTVDIIAEDGVFTLSIIITPPSGK